MSISEPPGESEETQLHRIAFEPQFRSRPELTWTDSAGHHTRVVDGSLVVGSAPGSGIVLHDATVSRLHAQLDVREDGLWIRDLGSRNGTFLEGFQVTGARVPQGARIRLGSTDLTVDYSAAGKRPLEVWAQAFFEKLVGRSLPMRELFANLARIAPMDASALIQGETGTGKELVARAIHDASPRANEPFVVIDCAALPENLLDAELFGHAKGAFTGAVGARPGAIESADRGTVFLDEIGELPMAMQPKLLRALESRTVRRIGETAHRTVDVRFVSATHRDLLTMVNAGEFREDLYFRLSVLPVAVPPLRDRREDIELLANHFLKLSGSNDEQLSGEVIRELEQRPWRGNVRELRNFMERLRAFGHDAFAMSPGAAAVPPREPTTSPGTASVSRIPAAPSVASVAEPQVFDQAYRDFRESWVDAGEREYVRRLLDRHNRNVTLAAKAAGVDRTHIYRLIRKHEL